MAAFVAALLSIGKVAELFEVRATLDQSYDVGTSGPLRPLHAGLSTGARSAVRHRAAAVHSFFPEDPHNTFLNAFMTGGWLGGVAYPTLSLVTVFFGLRFVATPTPWRPTYQAVYVAYVGTSSKAPSSTSTTGATITCILGVLWGLMAASVAYRRSTHVPGYRVGGITAARSRASIRSP